MLKISLKKETICTHKEIRLLANIIKNSENSFDYYAFDNVYCRNCLKIIYSYPIEYEKIFNKGAKNSKFYLFSSGTKEINVDRCSKFFIDWRCLGQVYMLTGIAFKSETSAFIMAKRKTQ